MSKIEMLGGPCDGHLWVTPRNMHIGVWDFVQVVRGDRLYTYAATTIGTAQRPVLLYQGEHRRPTQEEIG